MNAILRTLPLLLAAAFTPAALAAMSVDSLNYPVWVERGGRTTPVAPGDQLYPGDVVNTGQTGRAWLAIDEGSVIKLGQQARFVITRAEFRESGGDTVFDAAFNLLEGAFRFTSNFFPRARQAGHKVDFRIGAITAGVRGTDIWGRSAETEDFVALLDGSIEVSAGGAAPRLMEQALTLYRKPAALPAGDPQAVPLAAVQGLAPETELSAGSGIASTGGTYDLVLMSLRSNALAAASVAHFERAGFAVRTRPVEVDGRAYNRIVLSGLADLRAARNLRGLIAEQFDITDAWIIDGR